MSRIVEKIKDIKVFETRLSVNIIEECVMEFLISEYADNIANVEYVDDYIYDNVSLFTNDSDDIAISFEEENESLEKKLREDGLITEGDSFRATNLCCKAIANEIGCDYNSVDIWSTHDSSYAIVQLPVTVLK